MIGCSWTIRLIKFVLKESLMWFGKNESSPKVIFFQRPDGSGIHLYGVSGFWSGSFITWQAHKLNVRHRYERLVISRVFDSSRLRRSLFCHVPASRFPVQYLTKNNLQTVLCIVNNGHILKLIMHVVKWYKRKKLLKRFGSAIPSITVVWSTAYLTDTNQCSVPLN